MKKRLGNFELLEQIDPGGYTVVWRAVEQMGHGITRPAAVKLLQGWQTQNQEQIDQLRKEVSALADICQCPNIVTIYAFDIDDEIGPWIAMELGGRSLRHFISDDPADPGSVRQLLRDCLRALMAIHGARPVIIHRDIKPNNILSTEFGSWKLADFGLAKRSETESTLNVLTVQYSAPELLDVSLGKECAATDLYSLGLVAYEYALGRKGYKAQFPSIYDPYADEKAKAGDDRPKWMYWHTSPQMTVKPLAEVIEGFPKDLSDLIASMTSKSIADRPASASDAMARLHEASAPPRQMVSTHSIDGIRRSKSEKSSLVPLLMTAMVAVLVLTLAAWLYIEISSRPVITLANDASFKSDAPMVAVSGKIRNFPGRGSATIQLADGARYPVTIDSDGAFSAEVRAARIGETGGQLRVLSSTGAELASRNLRVERQPPRQVTVVTTTRPPVADAVVRIKETGSETPIVLRTSANGQAEASVKFGKFELEVEHPRYAPGAGSFDTGVDPTRTVTATLNPLSEGDIASKRRGLLGELDDVLRRVTGGDKAALERLAEIRRDMILMEPTPNAPEAQRRVSIMQEMIDTAERAFTGDARASTRLMELRAEAVQAEASAQAVAGSEQRQALMRELAELTDRATARDASVLPRLRQLQSDIRQLDAEEGASAQASARRARLLGEIGEAAERSARGDAQAAVRLREARRDLEGIEVPRVTRGISPKRAELADKLDDAASRAAKGEEAAIGEFKRLAAEIQELDKDESVQPVTATRRARLLGDMLALAEQAGRGNIDAALRLKGLQRDLAALDGRTTVATSVDEDVNARRRTALVRELGELVGKLRADDTAAPERIRKIRSELQMIDVSEGGATTTIGRRRADLLTELAAATELASARDENALVRIRDIQRELAVLLAVEQAGGDAASFATLATELLGGPPSLDLIDRATLLSLSDNLFRSFVETIVPTGAITVETVPNLRRIRVRGTVLNEREMQLLMVRLEPALPRLMTELRVDPWAVCRRLGEELESSGATRVRVHPHIAANDNEMFVQYERSSGIEGETVMRVSRRYVIDSDLIRLQAF